MEEKRSSWQFPTGKQVDKICQPGQGKKTCRYLTMGPNGWSCAKETSIGQTIDERTAQGSMKAQGDNCDGIINFLCDGRLVGKEVHHRETMPAYEIEGTVEELRVVGGMLRLKAHLKDSSEGWEFAPEIALGYININISEDRVVISASFPGGNTWTFYK